MSNFLLEAIGVIESDIKDRDKAAKQGYEGAPDVWLHVHEKFAAALEGTAQGDEVILITWFHQSHRDVLAVHPRGDRRNPLTGRSSGTWIRQKAARGLQPSVRAASTRSCGTPCSAAR